MGNHRAIFIFILNSLLRRGLYSVIIQLIILLLLKICSEPSTNRMDSLDYIEIITFNRKHVRYTILTQSLYSCAEREIGSE